MKKRPFISHLAHAMQRFVALCRMAGKDYHSQTYNLIYFDRFLARRRWRHSWISRQIVDDYFSSQTHLAPSTRRTMTSAVRQFCRYLSGHNPRCYVPDGQWSEGSQNLSVPFVFTQQQVSNLLAQAGKILPRPLSFSLRPHLYRTLLGLLYTTGIRIGEALALNIGDIDLPAQRLLVRKGKFGKARWIPCSVSTTKKLQEYLEQRLQISPATETSPLFINNRTTRLRHLSVHCTFHRLLPACGIPRGGHDEPSHARPTIHGLRHTFACHRLLAWYRDGLDINARLPALSTYMGHVNVHFTHRYLHATPDLLNQTHQRFLDHYRNTIKKENVHE